MLGSTKRGNGGFGSTGVTVIKKIKLENSSNEEASDLLENTEHSDSKRSNDCDPESENSSNFDQSKLLEIKSEEELKIVSEEAEMVVNDKVIIHEKITIDYCCF